MQTYTDTKFKKLDSRHNLKKNEGDDEDEGAFNKRPLKMAQDFILKAYDNHQTVKKYFKDFLEIL